MKKIFKQFTAFLLATSLFLAPLPSLAVEEETLESEGLESNPKQDQEEHPAKEALKEEVNGEEPAENEEVPKEEGGKEDASQADQAQAWREENTGLNSFLAGPARVHRLAGRDRIATALEASQFFREKSDKVLLADAKTYSDALAASGLSQGRYPLLLVDQTCSQEVLDEILRLEAKEVFILGGHRSISSQVEQELQGLGLKEEDIHRLAGANRYETSLAIAQQLDQPNLLLVSGENFPDALAAAPLAQVQQARLVLLGPSWPPAYQVLADQAGRRFVVGGPSSLDTDLLAGDKTLLAGKNRYETARILAQQLSPDFVLVASGENFPDALAISPLAMGLEAPILLTEKDRLSQASLAYLKDQRDQIKKVLVVGGEGAISPLVYKNIEEVLATGEIQTLPPKDLSLFKNNNQVMAKRATQLSGKIPVPQGQVCKVIAIQGEEVTLSYNGQEGLAQVDDYTVNNIRQKNTKVPYISQLYPVYAPVGCEAVSLLMGLKGKGYAKDLGTRQFLDRMPKHSSNPAKGYVGSPYRASAHLRTTIDPEPLAKYGAQYGQVANLQGASVDDLILELDNGNPVVVYVTLYWRSPYYRYYKVEGQKKKFLRNNHALLLTGYNKDSQEFTIADPYNHESVSAGRRKPYFYKKSRAQLEPLYNVRKYAVVVR